MSSTINSPEESEPVTSEKSQCRANVSLSRSSILSTLKSVESAAKKALRAGWRVPKFSGSSECALIAASSRYVAQCITEDTSGIIS